MQLLLVLLGTLSGPSFIIKPRELKEFFSTPLRVIKNATSSARQWATISPGGSFAIIIIPSPITCPAKRGGSQEVVAAEVNPLPHNGRMDGSMAAVHTHTHEEKKTMMDGCCSAKRAAGDQF